MISSYEGGGSEGVGTWGIYGGGLLSGEYGGGLPSGEYRGGLPSGEYGGGLPSGEYGGGSSVLSVLSGFVPCITAPIAATTIPPSTRSGATTPPVAKATPTPATTSTTPATANVFGRLTEFVMRLTRAINEDLGGSSEALLVEWLERPPGGIDMLLLIDILFTIL